MGVGMHLEVCREDGDLCRLSLIDKGQPAENPGWRTPESPRTAKARIWTEHSEETTESQSNMALMSGDQQPLLNPDTFCLFKENIKN